MRALYCLPASARFACILFIYTFLAGCTHENPSVTIEDYQRAEKFLSVNTTPLVTGLVTNIDWDAQGTLTYKNSFIDGVEYIRVDPATKKRERLFDHEKLAAELSKVTGKELKPFEISLTQVKISEDGGALLYSIEKQRYRTDLTSYETTLVSPSPANEILSPNGKLAAYIDHFNLWLRDVATGKRTQLTFDGTKDFGYATNNAGWTKSDGPVLLWSPGSDKIATFQHDGRGVGEMYLYNTQVGHSKLQAWKYPLPGDSLIFRIERVVVHITPSPKVVRLKMPPDAHRSTISDHIAGRDGQFLDVEWTEDGKQLAFVSSSRDHKTATLRLADPLTGEVRTVVNEVARTYFESGQGMVNWHVLKKSNEIIWFSERDNWGHLYLYDMTSGDMKGQITKGEWRVMQVLHIDPTKRVIYFLGSNKESGDPYFHYLYSINMDGTDLRNLTPEPAHHTITWNEAHNLFVDSHSTPTTAPVTVIRDTEGKVLMPLEQGDLTKLKQSGWVAPIPFTVKARDEKTDLYGLMYKPSTFSEAKRYPVLNYLYPGPQSGSVGSRSFLASRADKQSLAELGFIVVEVDAMGSPGRSKSFHDAYYGNLGDNGLPDQIGMIKQLAAQYSWMDLDRVGIWGHSGGGFASTDAILRYPDFYKVAVSGAGNHDNRNYEDDWGEKWHGLLVNLPESDGNPANGQKLNAEVKSPEEKTNYDKQANQLMARNLKGKLLIAHGMMDGNVPPTNTLLVVDALIAADKDFDMLVIPNAGHGFGNSRYFMKRRWDYFVRHLLGGAPPADFVFAENVK